MEPTKVRSKIIGQIQHMLDHAVIKNRRFLDDEQLIKAENTAGHGAVIRFGRGWTSRSKSQLETSCTPPTPVVVSSNPVTLVLTWPVDVYGTGFADVGGTLYIGNASTWAASAIKIAQPVSTWTPTAIHVTAVTWGPAPANVWLYVLNKHALVNAAGLGRFLMPAP